MLANNVVKIYVEANQISRMTFDGLKTRDTALYSH